MSVFTMRRPLPTAALPPTLLAVVDTEEEFDWNAPFDAAATSVENIGMQGLAQALFDRHGVVPTYVVDYPVATTPSAVAVLRGFLEQGRCEIGTHLHPWVSPPHEGPVDARHSFASNLAPGLVRRKLAVLTDAIERAYGVRPTVYKAGRYGVDAGTPAMLRELGYVADVSLVPYTSFASVDGPDFSDVPDRPFLTVEGIAALPLSVTFAGRGAALGPRLYPLLSRPGPTRLRLPGIAAKLGLLERLRLTPEGHELADMVRQTEAALKQGQRLFMLTYHSSTLMPGCTTYTPDVAARDAFLQKINGFLGYFCALPGACASTVSAMVRHLALDGTPGQC